MNILRLISKLTQESERDLKNRFRRARSLVTGKECPKDYLDKSDIEISGRVYLITTWRVGKGEQDFSLILKRHNHKIRNIIRLNWLQHGEQALTFAIQSNWSSFCSGDILAIVRGGGDTTDRQFHPFNNSDAARTLERLRSEKEVIIVTGIGHATDSFLVEQYTTFKQATPTDAAYKICDLLNVIE